MDKKEVLDVLCASARENGLVPTVARVFGRSITLKLPLSEQMCETAIDELGFSPRALHSLKRAGAFLVGDVALLIEGRGLASVRGLGKKTENEIKTRLLVSAYEDMTPGERRAFFEALLASAYRHS